MAQRKKRKPSARTVQATKPRIIAESVLIFAATVLVSLLVMILIAILISNPDAGGRIGDSSTTTRQ